MLRYSRLLIEEEGLARVMVMFVQSHGVNQEPSKVPGKMILHTIVKALSIEQLAAQGVVYFVTRLDSDLVWLEAQRWQSASGSAD